MKHLGFKPDTITFQCVLFTCNHVGIMDEGCKDFNSLSEFYCIIPGMNYYICIIYLLNKISIKLELGLWICLLIDCKLNVMILNALIDMYAKCKINPYNMMDYNCIIPMMNHYTYIGV